MHKIIPEEGNLLRVEVTGKLTQEDYDALIPSWEATIARHGSLRMIFVMTDFHGWTAGAAWDDAHFGLKHAKKVERVAMVGDRNWEKWMGKLAAVFAPDLVKYFERPQMAEAERWVRAR